MPLVRVVRNPEDLMALQLTNEDEMWEVFKFAKARGYSPTISPDSNGSVMLSLTNPQGNTSETARMNDWAVVVNDTLVRLVQASQAAALYSLA